MTEKTKQYYATDREIYDLLMASKQRISDSALYEIARERGIFYSRKTSREQLATLISMLPHDHADVLSLIQRRDHARRADKTTSIVLNGEVEVADVQAAIHCYQDEVASTEHVKSQKKGPSAVALHVEYDEIDYSKTRLIQRQRRDVRIEIVKQGSKTIIRMPATEKARAIVDNITDKIESSKKTKLKAESISLAQLDPPERTEFFTKLISNLPNYKLLNVTSLKVAFNPTNDTDADIDIETDVEEDGEQQDIEETMLAVVRKVVLSGQNLVGSPEYQELCKRGFFITGIRWQAQQELEPYHRLQFDADFENSQDCKDFRYAVRYSPQLNKGQYASAFKIVKEEDSTVFFELIESVSRTVLAELSGSSPGGQEQA